MKLFKTVLAVSVMLMMISCQSQYESKGNSAYKAAQKATGNIQKQKQKEAYMYYKKHLEQKPAKLSMEFRNRFIEMALVRAEMVLIDGNSEMDAIPLFMGEIDSTLVADINPEVKDRYADYLTLLADSSFTKRKLYKGLAFIDKALTIASDKSKLEEKKKSIIDNFAKENFEAAEIEMVNGKANEDSEAMVRAEFLTKVALYQDKNYPGAKEMLSKLYKENRSSYSAYDAVIIDKPDTTIYQEINKFDILMAIPKATTRGKNVKLEVEIFNYSYNPIRLKPSSFYIEDSKGKKYKALKSSKFEKELLDQEMETKMVLNFQKGSADIKRLVYDSKDNGEHYTEKFFY